MSIFVFIVLTVLGVVLSAGILFFKGGPGIVGVCGGLTPLVFGIPAAILVYVHPAFKQKFQGLLRPVLAALTPLVFFSLCLSIMLYDQNPHIMFKRLLSDPIPDGISNIRSYDDSGGFDVEYGLAFEATPESVAYIIAQNGFELNTEASSFNNLDAPFHYFPDVEPDQQWSYYSKEDKENENAWYLWVNADRTTVIFKFIGY